MLKRTYNPARVVEAIIEGMLTNHSPDKEVLSVPYQNGRERGFIFTLPFTHASLTKSHVFVAENRNSDAIQCVVSKSDTMFSAADYEAASYFKYDQPQMAAKFVLEMLLGERWWEKS